MCRKETAYNREPTHGPAILSDTGVYECIQIGHGRFLALFYFRIDDRFT
jgi:hypothetical protein